MKKILVTGSNGLLGQKLISLLQHSNRALLIAASKGENRYPSKEDYIYVEMDITNPDQIDKVISEHQPNAIINTAAITNVDICHKEHDLCRSVNVEGVQNLIAIAEKYQIHLIHLSTDFVFDGINGPYDELAEMNPISYYGESKRDAELLVMNAKTKWSIIRTVLVYGVTANMSRSNIVLWVKSSLENGKPIQVVNDQWRTPTLADDLAEGCLLVAENEAEGIYHISGDETFSVYQIAEQVADFFELDKNLITPVSSFSLNQEAKRPMRTGFVLNKAKSVLKYNPTSIIEGLSMVQKQLAALV